MHSDTCIIIILVHFSKINNYSCVCTIIPIHSREFTCVLLYILVLSNYILVYSSIFLCILVYSCVF